MAEVSVDQRLPVSLKITDRGGNPAVIDGVPSWQTSSSSAVIEDLAEDGLSGYITPADDAADEVVNVTVEVDADLGEGARPVIGVLTVTITGGEARFVELEAGAPEPKA